MSDRNQPKSQSTQLVLALLFGPFGLLYSSLSATVLLALAAGVLIKDFGSYGALLVWPIAALTGFFTVRHWNRRAAEQTDSHAPRVSDDTHAHPAQP
jgi:hypothetical protein